MSEPQERAKRSKALIAAGVIVAAFAIGGLGFWVGANRSVQTALSTQAGRTGGVRLGDAPHARPMIEQVEF